MANIIPELKLYDYLEKITSFMVADLGSATSDSNTVLYSILKGNVYKGDTYFNIAKELFLRSNTRKDKLNLQLYFHLEPTKLPSISLSVPSESASKETDTIGLDGGESHLSVGDNNLISNNRNFSASINIIVASKNAMEQAILAYVYKALLIAILPILDFSGFRNPSIGTQEVQIDPSLIGSNMYVRMITLSFYYEMNIPSTISRKIISTIDFSGFPVSDFAKVNLEEENLNL